MYTQEAISQASGRFSIAYVGLNKAFRLSSSTTVGCKEHTTLLLHAGRPLVHNLPTFPTGRDWLHSEIRATLIFNCWKKYSPWCTICQPLPTGRDWLHSEIRATLIVNCWKSMGTRYGMCSRTTSCPTVHKSHPIRDGIGSRMTSCPTVYKWHPH